ncbi:ABC transporter permease [Ulvibacterium sp.]|uniref:ABC transporter permease n=1 Tax=Ulvibacterium sp. TaxID=2665914 RepID=UPI003BAB129C
MFRNYLKIAFRNLWNNKAFSIINIIGLSIGLSASFVIGAIVYYDLTFDKFHPDGERIYRVTTDFKTPEAEFHNRGVAVPLGKALKEGVTGIELTSTFFSAYAQKAYSKDRDKVFRNPGNQIYADKEYFQIFSYEWLAGAPEAALSNPNEVVLTDRRAGKYFPGMRPNEVMGKTVLYNDSVPVKVVGVVSNFKDQSDFIFQEFLSLKTAHSFGQKNLIDNDEWNSTNSGSQVFIRLVDNNALGNVQRHLDRLSKENEDDGMYDRGETRSFHLQPLSDIHLNSDYMVFDQSEYRGSKTVLKNLMFVALFLLLLGCINFINLNTAQATKRSKEIGIRKTLGSSRKRLVFQFLGETFLLTGAAAIVSLFLSSRLLLLFNDFIPPGLNFGLFSSPVIVGCIILLLGVITLLSGFYPALVLSHFKPVSVLKNQGLPGTGKSTLRKYLTVFQFVIAQIFIVATILVGKQLNFLMNKDMGFKTEAIAYIGTWNNPDLNKRLNFAEELKSFPLISQVSLGWNPPASSNMRTADIAYTNKGRDILTSVQLLFGDLNYRELFDIKLLAGRERLNDTIKEYVINETYSKMLGFEHPWEAIGEPLRLDDELNPIVGVMEDFDQGSLRSAIRPMALVGDIFRNDFSLFEIVHFSLLGPSENWSTVMAEVEEKWKTAYPEMDFELRFMDDTIKQFYEQERRASMLLKWSTGLAILISCLGLLGLVIHTTERRTKEIGIRKVLGASLAQLNLLLCREFLILVGIAFAIAAPIAWWGLDYWLQGFAYRTTLSWWIFFLGGITMLLVALGIMSIRTLAAANADPVKSLRTE